MADCWTCPKCKKLVEVNKHCGLYDCANTGQEVARSSPIPLRDPLLEERQKTHGNFNRNATISQEIKEIYRKAGVNGFKDVHREALDMIALKLSRILSGQANFKDHWRDLSGYALLAMEACSEDEKPR